MRKAGAEKLEDSRVYWVQQDAMMWTVFFLYLDLKHNPVNVSLIKIYYAKHTRKFCFLLGALVNWLNGFLRVIICQYSIL